MPGITMSWCLGIKMPTCITATVTSRCFLALTDSTYPFRMFYNPIIDSEVVNASSFLQGSLNVRLCLTVCHFGNILRYLTCSFRWFKSTFLLNICILVLVLIWFFYYTTDLQFCNCFVGTDTILNVYLKLLAI